MKRKPNGVHPLRTACKTIFVRTYFFSSFTDCPINTLTAAGTTTPDSIESTIPHRLLPPSLCLNIRSFPALSLSDGATAAAAATAVASDSETAARVTLLLLYCPLV